MLSSILDSLEKQPVPLPAIQDAQISESPNYWTLSHELDNELGSQPDLETQHGLLP
jgi:hypothetical protein